MNWTAGIFSDETAPIYSDHIVSIVGFGEDDDGTPFWHVRNSWGVVSVLDCACLSCTQL